METKTTNFIKRAKEIHGDKYDYSKSVYTGSINTLIVTCPKHGDFIITPNKHLNNRGCPKCGQERSAEAHKLSVYDFIEKAKKVHANKYDYSLITEFNGVRENIKIICPIHGKFIQNAGAHLRGSGCSKCAATENNCMPLGNKIFIEKAKKVHGDKYDYSLVNYINNKTKVKIICPIHGVFEQKPGMHLVGQGCPKCAAQKRSIDYRTSSEDFIAKANIIHKHRYDYSLITEFTGLQDKVKIICPVHGEFEQQANSHLQGRGCPLCNGGAAFTLEKFIIKAKEKHGDKYDYSLIKEFNGVRSKVKIICPTHGIFEQTARKHLDGSECPKCAHESRYTKTRLSTEKFIEKAKEIHGNKYDYSLVNYINNKTKVKIICPFHGEFEQEPSHHLLGQGCRRCTSHISKQEKEVLEYIKSFYNGEIIENDRSQIKPKELDIFIPKLNFAIEYNGEYWHRLQEERDPGYHERKYKECKDKGINLLVIWNEDWTKRKDEIKKLIKEQIENLII